MMYTKGTLVSAVWVLVVGMFFGSMAQQYFDTKSQGANVSLVFSIEDWISLYAEEFGEDRDELRNEFAVLQFPEYRKDFDWLVVVKNGYRPSKVYERLSRHMKTWKWYDNLDAGKHHPQVGAPTYIVKFRAKTYPDKEWYGECVDLIGKRDAEHEYISLTERLLLELMYWRKTKHHLDFLIFTLCPNSRHADGSVMAVGLRHGEVCITDRTSFMARDFFLTREAIRFR